MYTLLSICYVLHPMKLEEGVLSQLSDKYQDKQLKMLRGLVFFTCGLCVMIFWYVLIGYDI